jgi:hypothetical protein
MSAACAWTSAGDHRSNAKIIDSRLRERNSGLTCALKLTVAPGPGNATVGCPARPPSRRPRRAARPVPVPARRGLLRGYASGRLGLCPGCGAAESGRARREAHARYPASAARKAGSAGSRGTIGGAHGELHPACPLLVGVPAAGAPAAARSRRRIAGCTTRGRRIPRRATWPRAACARAACPQTRAPAGHRLAPATHTAAGPLMDLAPACGSPGPRRRSRRAVRYPCYQRTRRKREPLSDGGVLGRGPTQPIAPYHAINYNAEVRLSEDGAGRYSSSNSHAWVTGASEMSSGAPGPPILVGTQPGSSAFDRTPVHSRATVVARRAESHARQGAQR